MNVTSGGLSFDFTATNDSLKKIIQESQKEIQGLADASKQGGKVMDAALTAAFDRLDQRAGKVETSLSETRQAIKALEKDITSLKAKADAALKQGDVSGAAAIQATIQAKERELQARNKVVQACYDAYDALDAERAKLEQIQQASQGAAERQESLRGQLRRAREELARLEATEGPGVRQTERFRELQEEAGALADALADAQQQVSVFSDDNANISGAMEGLGGLAGAFSAGQGVMSLFGVESEKVEQAMLRVQSAIAITNGVQQVANALNKDSAFMLVTVRKAKDLLAASELKLASALGVSTAYARVFMATITLGLSAAIGAIIYVVEKFKTASAEAEAFNKKVAESAAEPVGKIELLAEKWKRLGDDLSAKKRFIEDNKKAFEDLGVSIQNVADAENLLINNKDAFIAAQIEKAKAAIYIEEQKEAIKDLIKEEAKLPEQIRKTEEARQRALDFLEKNGYDAYYTSSSTTHHISKEEATKNINEACDYQIQAYKNKLGEMKAGITAGYKSAADAEERGLQIMKDAAIQATQDGEEAADAFTQYILDGTQQAEHNLDSFGGRVHNYFNNLISGLRSQSNSFANFFGNLLGKLFGGGTTDDLGDGTVGDRLEKVRAKHAEAEKKLADLRKKTSTATAKDIQDAEKEVQKYADLYKTLSGVTLGESGGGKTPGGGGTKKDPAQTYAQELSDKKALYSKYLAWVTSSDTTVRETAKTAFADLLKEGQTYLQFLEGQRDSLSQKASKTALDLQKLQLLNNEIAEATKDAVLNDFQKKLEEDLKACTTLGAMLDLIEQRRQEISGDTSELGDKEREILKTAEDDTKTKVKDETDELLRSYAGYEVERYRFAQTYARKHQLLAQEVARTQKALDEARSKGDPAATQQAQAEADAAKKAMTGLQKQNDDYAKATSQEYADLLEKYKTHQQQLADIRAKYDKERQEAAKAGNVSILQLIDKEEQEELSKLAASQLMASESWNELFSDLSNLSTTAINRLIKQVEANKIRLAAELNPADLKAVEEQLARAHQELQQRNPFLALKDSLADLRQAMTEKKLLADKDDPILQELEEKRKEYETIAANLANPATAPSVAINFKATLEGGADFKSYLRKRTKDLEEEKVKLGVEFTGQHELDVLIAMLNKVQGTGKSVGQGFKDAFKDVGSTIELLAGSFDAVVGGMKKMGIQMDEETEAILGDISGIMEGTQGLAQGIASNNPLSIIQGSITLFSSVFDLFNSRDRKAEASIRKHEEALGRLKNVYNELQHAIQRALGEEAYQNQSALIANLRKQQAEVSGMISDELSKKNSDSAKVEEYQEQYKELGRQITDIMDEITASITQTTAKDLAGSLADALVEAFEGGEDAAKAFGEVADDVIKKAVLNALKLQMLEKPLQAAIKQLQRDMGFNEDGSGTFNGLSEAEQKKFKAAVEAAGANFQAAMDMYKGLFEQLDDSDPTTLSGAIKGASQESIDLLAGQTNAVRQNQVTSLNLLRQQLIHLSNIDANIGTIAGRLLTIMNYVTTPQGTGLRSQGITD